MNIKAARGRTDITDDAVIAAYKRTGSVWIAAEELGIAGQTVSRRLARAGYKSHRKYMTADKIALIDVYYRDTPADQFSLDEIAGRVDCHKTTVCATARKLGLTDLSRTSSSAAKKNMRAALAHRWEDKPHPRGMAGKKHSTLTLARLSEASKAKWATAKAFGTGLMSEEHRIRRSKLMVERAKTRPAWKSYTRTRGGVRPDIGPIYFRSSWEANYARYLNLLKKMGAVVSWEYEAETFWFGGIQRGVVSYKPDFRVYYKNDPTPEYIEIKGWVQNKDLTKWRRMKKYHPRIKLTIVGEKEYYALKNKWSSSIPEWEGAIGGGRKLGPRKAAAA